MKELKSRINTRYVGVILIIIAIAMALVTYSFSNMLLQLADRIHGGSCPSIEECPHVATLNQAYTGYTLSLIIGVIGVFLLVFGGKPEVLERGKIEWEKRARSLSGEERDIYKTVMESEGVIFQSDLVEKSGFSKVKVSRVLDKLEAKGLVERKRRGMSNVVVLK